MNSRKAEKPRPVGYPSSKDRGFKVPKNLGEFKYADTKTAENTENTENQTSKEPDLRTAENANLRTAEKALINLGLKKPQIPTSHEASVNLSSPTSSPVNNTKSPNLPNPTYEDFESEYKTGTPRVLNEILVYHGSKAQIKHHLVLLHGAMAGLAYFYRNLEPLSRKPGWGVYAVDWIGMGRSSRPDMKPKETREDERIREIEWKFIDRLEEWRIKRLGEDKKFMLVGHSFGGYLGMRYALKYPHAVNKLIMVSPVGVEKLIPSRPPVSSTPASSSSLSTTDTGHHTTVPTTYVHKPWFHRPLSLSMRHQIIPPFLLPKLAPMTSFFSLPHPVASWMSKRLSDLGSPEESAWLFQYTLRLLQEGVGGDSALCYLADAGVVIKKPLCDAVEDLVERGIPSVWVYGEEDWMDPEAGKRMVGRIRQLEGMAGFVEIVGAGHQVYLDRSREFNELIWREMEGVEKVQEQA
ncbi:Alpha/Beta hydrolase protein [Pyronema omphalodes]|nr:Alpha/Beta hydrolase protein [Pyronema omphalodes]